MCSVPELCVLLRKMIYFLERKEGIRNDNHFLNTLACSCVGLWHFFFFISFSAEESFDLGGEVYNRGGQ